MIKPSTAQKLKDAGLNWEPKNGDWFATGPDEMANIFVISGEHSLVDELGGKMWFFHGHFYASGDGCFMDKTASNCMNTNGFKDPKWKIYEVSSIKDMIWIPRLDQLLAEIEKLGWSWSMGKAIDNGANVWLTKCMNDDANLVHKEFRATNEDNTAALALYHALKHRTTLWEDIVKEIQPVHNPVEIADEEEG